MFSSVINQISINILVENNCLVLQSLSEEVEKIIQLSPVLDLPQRTQDICLSSFSQLVLALISQAHILQALKHVLKPVLFISFSEWATASRIAAELQQIWAAISAILPPPQTVTQCPTVKHLETIQAGTHLAQRRKYPNSPNYNNSPNTTSPLSTP